MNHAPYSSGINKTTSRGPPPHTCVKSENFLLLLNPTNQPDAGGV